MPVVGGTAPFCEWLYDYTPPPPHNIGKCEETFQAKIYCRTSPLFGLTGWFLGLNLTGYRVAVAPGPGIEDFIQTVWSYHSTNFNCIDGGTFTRVDESYIGCHWADCTWPTTIEAF